MAAPAPLPTPLPETLRFQCHCCGSTLEVPSSFAGVSGPCPHCGNEVTAPSFEAGDSDVQDWKGSPSPDPSPQRDSDASGAQAVSFSSGHLEQPASESSGRSDRDFGEGRDGTMAADENDFADDDELLPEEEEILFDEEADSPGEPRRGSSKSKGSRHRIVRVGSRHAMILGWGSIALFAAAVVAAFLCLRFSEPIETPQKEIPVPKDLTAQVLWQKDRMTDKKEKAIHQAIECVRRFLATGSAGESPGLLKTAQSTPPKLPVPLFPDLKPEELSMSAVSRKPGTEEFVTTVEPSDGRGPIFIVEQHGEESWIHADALMQQVDDKLNAFLKSTMAQPLLAYVLARPFRGQYPNSDLDSWPKLDIMPPFPTSELKAFVVCARPGTAVAKAISKRDPTYQWSRAVIELRWSRTPDGKEFIEIADLVPNSWARF